MRQILHQAHPGYHAAQATSCARHALPVRTALKSAPSTTRSISVLPRLAARNVRVVIVASSSHSHPDFPKRESLCKWGQELREEDILELESFLQSFQQRRDVQGEERACVRAVGACVLRQVRDHSQGLSLRQRGTHTLGVITMGTSSQHGLLCCSIERTR
eukprot:1161059-Pelagomonas_calceolata.AAC.4